MTANFAPSPRPDELAARLHEGKIDRMGFRKRRAVPLAVESKYDFARTLG
jgi:hypothetical protein